MIKPDQIQYYVSAHIDRDKWDACINNAENGLVYAAAGYLDAMADSWDGLVLNDYEAVMPLPRRTKYGIDYLYQPAFVAEGGIFGRALDAATVANFISSIPAHFRLIEIALNHGNLFDNLPGLPHLRTNYVLPLDQPYDSLAKGYRENLHRNIRRAEEAGCVPVADARIDEIIALNRQFVPATSRPDDRDYRKLQRLFDQLRSHGSAVTYGVRDNQGNLLSGAVFFFSHGRAYYILPGNHPNGKTLGASHYLVDRFIADHAGQDLLLDFEGSDVSSVAFFYQNFGARTEKYPALRVNRLPFFLRWLKK